MNTIINTKTAFFGLCMAVALFATVVPSAHAQTYYYYPTTPVYAPTYTTYNSSAQIAALTQQIYALTAQLQALQQQQQPVYPAYPTTYPYVNQNYYTNYTNTNYSTFNYSMSVRTGSVYMGSYEQATFNGTVSFNGAPYAYVWFEYGTDGSLTQTTPKTRTTATTFSAIATNLYSNNRYYVRAVAEDPNGNRTYGELTAFNGNGSSYNYNNNYNYNNEPDVSTDDAYDITSSRATMTGSVDMNDYNNGLAFFVYGTSENYVEDVTNENRYSDISTHGDSLRKAQVYSGLDDNRTLRFTTDGLSYSTNYYYRVCVQYEDNNGYDTLSCGQTERFETEN